MKNEEVTVAPIIREKQRLQLCAVHALNSLLQLSPCDRLEEAVNYSEKNRKECKDRLFEKDIILYSGYLYRKTQMIFATKTEFDEIANELSLKERELMGRRNSFVKSCALIDSVYSNHRTLVTGNYSIEVLEESLKRRGVDLKWLKVENDEIEKNVGLNDTTSRTNMECFQEVIGFVINSSTISSISSSSSISRLIPFFMSSRHWFVITRIRRIINKKRNANTVAAAKIEYKYLSEEDEIYSGSQWYVIDSKILEIRKIDSKIELFQFLLSLQKSGANIFKATSSMSPIS